MALFLALVAAGFDVVASTSGYLKAFLVCGGAIYLAKAARKLLSHEDAAPYVIQGGVLLCYLAYWCLRESSTTFYRALGGLSLAYSGAVGSFISRPIAMGVTYSGVDVVALFVAAAGVTAWFYDSKPLARFAVDLGAIAAIWAFYIGFWTALAENTFAFGLNILEPLTGPLDFRALLFGMLLAAHMARRALSGDGSHAGWRKPSRAIADAKAAASRQFWRAGAAGKWILAGAAAACAAMAFLLVYKPGPPPPPADGALVVFWDSGVDFTAPTRGEYGLDRVGMFGVLPRYLQERGYTCRFVEDIDGAALDGADVLAVFNPMRTPSQGELDAIWDFARRGGGVLAVGDHTGHEQIRLPLNAILSPVGIEFNFDSAMPFQSLWPKGFAMRKSPVFHRVADKQLQVVVGASLKVGGKARPLLVGPNAYSDEGDYGNEADGFLGDMSFSRGERVGDLVLVAEARYGDGVFVAFGDTTAFQNTVLAHSAPFVDNIFAHCAAGRAGSVGGGATASDSNHGSDPDPDPDPAPEPAPDPAPAYAPASIAESIPAYGAYCLIDVECFPAFAFDKSGESMDGFAAAALRAGMMPYFNINESLADAIGRLQGRLAAVVLVEPARVPGAGGMQALWSALDSGSTLVLLGGYASPSATIETFAQFGFGFDNMPIGRIAPTQDPEMAFWDACPVVRLAAPGMTGRLASMAGGQGAGYEDIVEIWGNAVVSRLALSEGEVVAIGDSAFLKNKNLEGVDSFRAGNVAFVEEMLDRALELHGKAGIQYD